jgi:hypothetical protein
VRLPGRRAGPGVLPPPIASRCSDLAEIIGITDLTELPGGHHGRQAIGYFIADPDGASAAEVVDRMISHVLLYALQAERRSVD